MDAVFTRFLYEPQQILAEDTLHSFAQHGCLEQVHFGPSDVQELVQLVKTMAPEAVSASEMKMKETKVCTRRVKNKKVTLPWFGNYILREHEKGVTALASALAAKTHTVTDPNTCCNTTYR